MPPRQCRLSTLSRALVASLTLVAGCPLIGIEQTRSLTYDEETRIIFDGDRCPCPPCPTTTTTIP